MKALRKVYDKHYYAIWFFVFLVVYSCVVPGEMRLWKAEGVNLSFHAVDYSMGFCSRFLPGAIYNLFFDSVNSEKTGLYLSALIFLFFAILSIILEKFILNIEQKYLKTAFVILLFFLTGPATFSIYVARLGMLDFYWVLAGVLFFALIYHKNTYIFMFIPFVLCILVCYTSIIAYIPFFTIIALYKISVIDSKKEKALLAASLSLALILSLGLFLYFILFEKQNLVYSMDEFNNIITSRGAENTIYFDQTLYHYFDDAALIDFFSNIKENQLLHNGNSLNFLGEAIFRMHFNFTALSLRNKFSFFLVLSPVVVVLYSFLFYKIKNCKKIYRKIVYAFMAILPVVTMVASVLTTTDLIRWTSHSFLPMFISSIYILHSEAEENWEYINSKINSYSFKSVAIYLVLYAVTIYDPYFV